ncbi:MAG: leucyl aminopeptidase [Acidobacteria bacterium]|nr:leucyl aminopeptidase [Acidobacteriota bacterium]
MRIEIGTESYLKARADGLMIFAGEAWEKDLAEIDKRFKGALIKTLTREKYRGKPGELCVFHTHGMVPAEVIVVAGDSADPFLLRRSAYLACRKARDAGITTLAVKADGATAERGGILAEIAILALYSFDRYKQQQDSRKEIRVVRLLLKRKTRDHEQAIRAGTVLAGAACYTRDLINEPAGVVTPSYLANRAVELKRANRGIACEVRGAGWMKKQGMGGLLGVARGSREEPRFIVLRYRPAKPAKRIAIVGKGITFDSGGLSLKTADQMVSMKCDMSGAATVLGVFSALSHLKPAVEVIGVIPTTENMPGGAAYKPGDILRMMNGKTVEILNTDAEGRLILADALVYAERQKPDWIVDLATLTGACVVALGDNCTGLMGTDEALKKALQDAARGAGERLWELPLLEEYRETLKSDIADIKNANYGRDGGAIKAGLFLREFVSSTPWVHLDIAGPAFMEKEVGFYGKGATGHGVGTLLRLCMNIERK